MEKRPYIGPFQRELLELAAREQGVALVGFAQRGWRGWKSMWKRGLLDVRDGNAYATEQGLVELERCRRRDEILAQAAGVGSGGQVRIGM
jgi:hypothetical protein